MCWLAADRGADLARERGDSERAGRWQQAADAMKAEILDKGVDEQGRFRQAYENDELDASLLLLPIMGFLPPDDERIKATVLAIADELTEDGLVLRYKVDSTDTGFAGKEGTFTICSWWLVSALAMIGETDRARALCKKLLSYAGPLNLYAEEIDTSTGEHLGNFPQAFTHLALIEAVSQLIEQRGVSAVVRLVPDDAPGAAHLGSTWRRSSTPNRSWPPPHSRKQQTRHKHPGPFGRDKSLMAKGQARRGPGYDGWAAGDTSGKSRRPRSTGCRVLCRDLAPGRRMGQISQRDLAAARSWPAAGPPVSRNRSTGAECSGRVRVRAQLSPCPDDEDSHGHGAGFTGTAADGKQVPLHDYRTPRSY